MDGSSGRRTVTLRDGARVRLRPIAPGDKPLLAASFEQLSEESRYRRFFTAKNELSEADLDYLVDVDHSDHEAIVAVDPASGNVVGVARYIRSTGDPEVAEVAVTVVDDWQGRGLGRALTDRLTYRARREGVRRFSALVHADNPASLALLKGTGDTRRRFDSGKLELVIELPPKRGMGSRLSRALRAAAAGSLVPAQTLADSLRLCCDHRSPRSARSVRSSSASTARRQPRERWRRGWSSICPGRHAPHRQRAGALQPQSGADAILARATGAARRAGVAAVTHSRTGGGAEALIAVAAEEDADLLVVGSDDTSGIARLLPGKVPDRVSHSAPCHVLIVRDRTAGASSNAASLSNS